MGSVSSLNSLLSSTSVSSQSSSMNLSSLLQAATGATSPGIDVNSAVQAAIYAAQAPERQWQAEQSSISAQITALTGIQSSLTTLNTDLNDLNNLQGSLASCAVSSSSTAVTATAAPGTVTGNHSIAVQNLSSTASWYSPALSSAASLGSSTLTITGTSGSQFTFQTGAGTDSLAALAQAINASSAGVSASVINDVTGSRLALVSSTSGSAADFSVSYGASGATNWSSASLPSASSAFSQSGSFQVGDGTATATVRVNPGDTLATVASSINAQGLGITASVVSDSAGAHLQIAAQTGASVSVSADPTFSFTRAAIGANANITVDGVPVSSASNTVTGAIPGLTLNLTGTTPLDGSASLSVTADNNTIQQALSKFVGDYNAVLSAVGSQFSFSASTKSEGALSGDSSVRSLQSALLGMAAYTGTSSPSPGASAPVNSLADLGITMADDGTLSLDSAKLTTALSNPSAVQNFFQGNALNGFAQQLQAQVTVYNNPADGSITQELNSLNQQYTALGSEVTNYESGYIASQKTVLTAMYSQAEIALQQLPAQMKEIQAELSNNSSGG